MRKNELVPFLILLIAALIVLAIAIAGVVKGPEVTGSPSDYPFLSINFVKAQIREQAIAHGASPSLMVAVAGCESGWRPLAVSPNQQDIGLFQLNVRGLAPKFFRRGYHSLFNSFEQSSFAAEEFSQGRWYQWSCAYLLQGRMPPWWYGHFGG